MATLFFSNCDFDLNLKRGFGSPSSPLVFNLDHLFLVLAGAGDFILTRVVGDDDFYAYLATLGLHRGKHVSPDDISNLDYDDVTVWGEDEVVRKAVKRKNNSFCDFELIKRVNSRAFSFEIARELDDKLFRKTFNSPDELEMALADLPFPLVIKPAFSSSASGFVILASPEEYPVRKKWILKSCQNGPFYVEQWVKRVADFSYGFTVDNDGRRSCITLRKLVNGDNGVFSSVLGAKESEMMRPFWDIDAAELEVDAARIADKLAGTGYCGKVGVDGFWYEHSGTRELNRLSEINCRWTMADLAQELCRITGGPYVQIVSLKRKDLSLKNYQELMVCTKLMERSYETRLIQLLPFGFSYRGRDYRSERLFYAFASGSPVNIDNALKLLQNI